jgi:hypothetical protein
LSKFSALGALHVKEIDPRRIDAVLSAQAASWILAEFIRQYHVNDEAEVEQAMAILMRPHIPLVEQFGDEHAVTASVPCEAELLLLLARSAPQGLDRKELGKACKYPPSTITGALKRLDDARCVHQTRDGRFHITGPGEVHLTRLLDQRAA